MDVLALPAEVAVLVTLGVVTVLPIPESTEIRSRIALHAASRVSPKWSAGRFAAGDPWTLVERIGDAGHVNRIPVPRGIVATAEVVDCVPIVDLSATIADVARGSVVVTPDELILFHETNPRGNLEGRDLAGQRPYGEFLAGRWALLLYDVRALAAQVPFKVRGAGWTREWDPPSGSL